MTSVTKYPDELNEEGYYDEVELTKEEKVVAKEIDNLLKEATKAVQKAEKLAIKHGLTFHWDGGAGGLGDFNHPASEYDETGRGVYAWSTSSIGC